VRILVDKGAALNYRDGYNVTALSAAVKAGHLEVANFLLEKDADLPTEVGENNETALHIASRHGNVAMLRSLLENGGRACIDKPDAMGNTPLMVAAMHLRSNCANLLLEQGATVNHSNQHGNTAVLAAANNHDWPLVMTLLDYDADIHHIDNRQQGLMYYAAHNGQATLIERFALQGLSVNQQTEHKETPLMAAANGHHYDAVKKLLALGADIKATDGWGCNALQIACFSGIPSFEKSATVIQLVSHGALITKTTGRLNASPLFSGIPNVLRISLLMCLHDKHLTDVGQMRLLAQHFPYNENQQHWRDRYKEYLKIEKADLEKRQSEYHYYGLFKYLGANSKQQELTAIDHFIAWLDGDKTQLTEADRAVLNRGHCLQINL